MLKIRLILSLLLVFDSVFSQKEYAQNIHWPAAYEPKNSSFFVHNEIYIEAPPQRIWQHLTEALYWPIWYKGAKNVSFITQSDTVLTNRSVFRWKTMGLHFESTVQQFKPLAILAWESKKKSIQGYHVWILIPGDSGCRVITEESQNGWLTYFEKTFQPKKLKKLHAIWLTELKKKAENTLVSLDTQEKTKMVEILNNTLKKFNEAVAGLSDEQFHYKPAADQWSIAECVEHLALAELEFPKIIKQQMQEPADPEGRKSIKIQDEEIHARMTSRNWKAKSPAIFKPSQSFQNVQEALETFRKQRIATIAYVQITSDNLRNHYWKHPLTGKIDLYQTLLLMSAHVERHLQQIETLKIAFQK